MGLRNRSANALAEGHALVGEIRRDRQALRETVCLSREFRQGGAWLPTTGNGAFTSPRSRFLFGRRPEAQ
jgi:hypothetical protein